MGATTALLTVDEFLKLPEVEGCKTELIQGDAVSMAHAGYGHEKTKSNITRILVLWLGQDPITAVFDETAYRLDEHTVLIPGVSVLSNERQAPGAKGLIQGAPDLAIEVVSSETASDLQGKIKAYLKHSSKAVWLLYPEHRMVRIYSAGGRITDLEVAQLLEDQDVLPGFSVPISAIFEGL
jgi:Uma2 family endonuclease